MIPRKFAPALFGFILSGLMSLVVSGVTAVRTSTGPGLVDLWIDAWLTAWLVAFPIVLVAAPLARRVVDRSVARGASQRTTLPTSRR